MKSKDIILKTADLPAVPHVATKILDLIEDENASLEDLKKAIMADQSLTTRILKIANSAFYNVRQNVDTISDAISIVGLNTIKSITLAVSTREIYKSYGIIEQKLWEHSMGVSVAAGVIAGEVPFIKKEEAVVAGLLHDIGKVVMNNSQPEKFSMLINAVHEEGAPFSKIELDYFEYSHAEAGFVLAEKWGFTEVLANTILGHHCWNGPGAVSGKDPYTRSLCLIIALADALCAKLGLGYRGPVGFDLGEETLREQLKISSEQLEGIISMFKNDYIHEKMFFV
ncbi:MAG: HDOD domain-containing protein [Nitrospiraceae bacterium]|nr:HDOD domain-containing protein [Nitrospiraceae bacterium]